MNVHARPGRKMMGGTLWIFLSELILLPTGLLTVAALTRNLGPENYGLFVLTVSFVGWIEWSVTAMFARAAVKFIGESEEWQPAAASLIRLYGMAGLGAALLLWTLAPLASRLFKEEEILAYLFLLGFDIPVFFLAQAYRSVLVGIGRFRERAFCSAGRWLARFFLIVTFVSLGFSVKGAIVGIIGASFIELLIGYWSLRLPMFYPRTVSLKPIRNYFLPLLLSGSCLRFLERLDLFALKALGGSAALAGFYGAAQSLAVIPGILALAFSPLLLSTLSRLRQAGDMEKARELARNAVRFVAGLLPFAALVAGSAPEIVRLIAGPAYAPSAGVLAFLIFGTLSLLMISVATTLLIAMARPALTFAVTGPLVPLAFVGHLFLIPRFGAAGASFVTASVAFLGAAGALSAAQRVWTISPPYGTWGRSLSLSFAAFFMAALWPASGGWLFPKLFVISAVVAGSFALLGEFSAEELAKILSFLKRRTSGEGAPAHE